MHQDIYKQLARHKNSAQQQAIYEATNTHFIQTQQRNNLQGTISHLLDYHSVNKGLTCNNINRCSVSDLSQAVSTRGLNRFRSGCT